MDKILTIDGPSGVGKGTVTRLIATKLGWDLLDSGAIYRALALSAIDNDISNDDKANLVKLANKLNISFKTNNKQGLLNVYLNGKEVSKQLRSQSCGEFASKIAKLKSIRQSLLQKQRNFASAKGLVADGRDMGTVVFPKAKFKFFLTASSKERAKRRFKQLHLDKNNSKIDSFLRNLSFNLEQNNALAAEFLQVKAEIARRDKRDKNRPESPLKPAADAVIINTNNLSITGVLKEVYSVFLRKNT